MRKTLLSFFFLSLLCVNAHAALIGVDFGPGGQLTPNNWTSVSAAGDYLTLIDETGTTTAVNLKVEDTGGSIATYAATVDASTIPSHSNSLANIGGNVYRFASGATLKMTFSGLDPLETYNVWVLGLRDGAALDQGVTLTNGGISASFAQSATTRQLVVNEEVGASARSFGSYGYSMQPSVTGTIIIEVAGDNEPSGLYSVAGVAVEKIATPSTPAHSAWSLGLFALLLAGGAVWALRRSRLRLL